jgi:hypothetical protein
VLKGTVVNPRQRAKTQDRKTLMVAWQEIPWKQVQRHVFRLQKRMYQATQRGDVRTVRKLQNLLTKSWYARLLAVRRVTQDNKGRHTAGLLEGRYLLCWGNLSPKPPNKDAIPPHRKQWGILA